MTPHLESLDHLVLTVVDLNTTVRFYEDVLGMTAEEFRPADGSLRVALKFGSQKINLHQAGSEFEPRARRATPGSADLCFVTAIPLDQWIAHLASADVAVESGPVVRTGAVGPLVSIYLRDPDDNLIEISNRA